MKLFPGFKQLPAWLKFVNILILLPIIVFPLVFLGTIFMFDHPDDSGMVFIYFILINSYPILLIYLVHLDLRAYQKNKSYGSVLSVLILTLMICGIVWLFRSMG